MPDKHEVGGSSPLGPTSVEKTQQTFIENRIKKKETKQIVVLRDFLIMRLEGLSKSKGYPKG